MKKDLPYNDLFARNFTLFTAEQMEKLRKARCLSLGVGAMGGVATLLLARAGVENFILVDYDKFESHNMNRQPVCLLDTIGQAKTVATVKHLQNINPAITVEAVNEKISRGMLNRLLPKVDIVLLSADEGLIDILFHLGKAKVIWAFCSGGLGVLATTTGDKRVVDFQGLELPWNARQLWELYRDETGFTDDWWQDMLRRKITPSTWNVTTWILGSLMAGEAVKIITEKWEPVSFPRFWFVSPKGIQIRVVNRSGIARTLISTKRKEVRNNEVPSA